MSALLTRARELQARGATLAGIEGLAEGGSLLLTYHFLAAGKLERLEVPVDGACPSLIALWGYADYLERDLHGRFGVKFVGNPNLEKPR